MSNNIKDKDVWLIGAGTMAMAYADVLIDRKVNFNVIGRGPKSAKQFYDEKKMKVIEDGVEKALKETTKIPKYAIVAINTIELSDVCNTLIKYGVKNILVEKPAGLNKNEIEQTAALAEKFESNVYVAYNRRFYSSVIEAEKIIKRDGGIASFDFEFTEWAHVIKNLNYPEEVFNAWFLANSTHVIDLAFYLGGSPRLMTSYTSGRMDWYKKASVFAGAGVSEKGALFSYQANWRGPGRWALEIITSAHRLIFRPLERLQVQNLGSVAIEEIKIDDELDIRFKPGLYLQTQSFLTQTNKERMLTIQQHAKKCDFYEQMQKGLLINE